MPGYIYIVIIVVVIVAAAVAVAIIARLQAKRLRKRVRLEIANLGNMRSRYELRAEDPDDALKFQFTLDGDRLPQRHLPQPGEVVAADMGRPVPSGQPAREGGIRQGVDRAVGLGGSVAGALTALGMLLPSSMRGPLMQMSSRMRSGQMKVQRVEQLPGRVTRVKSVASPRAKAKGQARPDVETSLHTTVETPFVRPGETLAVDLLISAVSASKTRHYPFHVGSRSVEQGGASWLLEESSVRILAATGLRRYLPYLIVFAVAAAILVLVVWLAFTNGLS